VHLRTGLDLDPANLLDMDKDRGQAETRLALFYDFSAST
jgi:hypothetical protein